jgi:hypothetical protein
MQRSLFALSLLPVGWQCTRARRGRPIRRRRRDTRRSPPERADGQVHARRASARQPLAARGHRRFSALAIVANAGTGLGASGVIWSCCHKSFRRRRVAGSTDRAGSKSASHRFGRSAASRWRQRIASEYPHGQKPNFGTLRRLRPTLGFAYAYEQARVVAHVPPRREPIAKSSGRQREHRRVGAQAPQTWESHRRQRLVRTGTRQGRPDRGSGKEGANPLCKPVRRR